LEQNQIHTSTLKKECRNAVLEYSDHVMIVRLKEGAEINIASMKEQYELQKTMVGNEEYVVLIDASKNSMADGETRQFMADYHPVNRKATAIVSDQNLAVVMMANFYLRFHAPKVLTKLFKHENEAMNWLNSILIKR
jgi:hypothetical protein